GGGGGRGGGGAGEGGGAGAGSRRVGGVGGRGRARACARRERAPCLRPGPSSTSRPRTRHTVKLTPYAACPTLGSMFGVGMPELIVILVIALIVLGPKRLPEVARTLGKAMAEFRRQSSEIMDEFQAQASLDDDARPRARTRPAPVPPPATVQTAPRPGGAREPPGVPREPIGRA